MYIFFNRRQNGFSLLELLVVLVIIGVIIAIALLALGDMGKSRQIKNARETLANLLAVVEEQAILEPNIYGLEINTKGYSFYKIKSSNGKKHWEIINDSLLNSRTWPAGTHIELTINRQANSHMRGPVSGPAIIINSSGNITPFTLNFNNHYSMTALESGEIIQKDL